MGALIADDLLFPAEAGARAVARDLYAAVKNLPIVSPHGHTDPALVCARRAVSRSGAAARSCPTTTSSACCSARASGSSDLGVPMLDGTPVETDGRTIWRRFAENYYLFRGTPTRLWFDYVLSDLFGIDEPLTAETADAHYDTIAALLQDRRVPAARAVQALQHRGDRHHRRRARRSEMAQDDPRQRLGRARRHRLPARRGRRSGFRGLCRQSRQARRDHRLRHRHMGRLSRRPPQAARLFQGIRRDLQRPRPSDRRDGEPFRRSGRGTVRPHPARLRATSATVACSGRRC